jgi:hypothetical protein
MIFNSFPVLYPRGGGKELENGEKRPFFGLLPSGGFKP